MVWFQMAEDEGVQKEGWLPLWGEILIHEYYSTSGPVYNFEILLV